MRRLGLSILALMIMNTAFAQYTFEGKVVDESQEPIIGASVVYGNKQGTFTNAEGQFSFEYDKPDQEVKVSYVGFQTLTKTISASETITIQLDVSPNDDTDHFISPVVIQYKKFPISFSYLNKDEIEDQNLGQDVPFLLDQLTSVVTTSDAGAGVGYTGLRVRGSDASRVNVTINGVPLNDAESQGTFWVDLPDFAASTDNMVLVRGAGTSTNGAGAFGASLHLQTQQSTEKPYGQYSGSAGSFNTLKNSVKFGTGTINDRWSVNGRLSKINSDGYIDRATADLQSYYFDTEYKLNTSGSNLKFITFSGHEVTYQAWEGVPENLLETNRTFNPYTYENQVDDYQQDHYQLLLEHPTSEKVKLNAALHYTKGQGFFEQFREGDDLATYGVEPQVIGTETITESDLVRRRWLDNDFFGTILSANYSLDEHYLILGGGWNKYLGDHFGEVISGQFIPQTRIGQNYYENEAQKSDFNIYGKYNFEAKSGLAPYVDLQYRRVNYDFEGLTLNGDNVVTLPQTVNHNFFNPKAGLTWELNSENRIYLSAAVAQKEPNRSDYVDSPADQLPDAEKLIDYELGYTRDVQNLRAAVNVYFMDYTDQLAVTGGVNDVGEYTRINVDDSYRAGVELTADWMVDPKLQLSANATFSQNKIKSFTERIDDFDNGGAQLVQHTDTDLALSPNAIAAGTIAYSPIEDLKFSFISKYVGQQFLDNTSTDARSIDAYWVNNLGLNATLGKNLGFLKAIDINARVNNLFNEEYEANGYTFGYIFGGETIYEEFYYPQAGTYFLTGLNLKF